MSVEENFRLCCLHRSHAMNLACPSSDRHSQHRAFTNSYSFHWPPAFQRQELEPQLGQRQPHSGPRLGATAHTAGSGSIPQASATGSEGWCLSADECASSHHRTDTDRSHSWGTSQRCLMFFLSWHCVTVDQMETSQVIRQDKPDRTVNHKIAPNCRRAESILYNLLGIWCFLFFVSSYHSKKHAFLKPLQQKAGAAMPKQLNDEPTPNISCCLCLVQVNVIMPE